MLGQLSIRTRITLGSVAVGLVLLVVALVVVRVQVASILSAADMSLAQSDLASFQKDITAHPEESVDDPGTGVLVYVRAPDGTVQVDTLPHDVRILVEQQPAADEQYTTTDDEGRTFVVVGKTVDTSDGAWALWSARSTASSELALEGLDHVLVIAGLVLLAGFGFASWLLATVALRPVNAMRRQAERLGADDTDADARLPVGAAHDELAALATTLNAFLARVNSTTAREKQMVSDASHELRTPLAVLKTQLELAHDDFGNAEMLAQHVQAAEQSVDRLTALASNLLELNRIEAGTAGTAHSTARELTTEFLGSVDRARMLALRDQTEVGLDIVGVDDDVSYAIDSRAFGRLVDNLFVNAINAVGNRGRVSGVLHDDESGLVLEVRDDGPGMPDDFVPVAFERFSRPDASRSSATGGSGLGLALVLALAQDAGGSATVTNTRPGLLVTVKLPKM